MADFIVNTFTSIFNAEEGTTLATVATILKYCIFMAIPFIGWAFVEVFFVVITNPILFAGLWVIATIIGLLSDYISNRQRLDGNNNGDGHRGIPPLLDFRPVRTTPIADAVNNNENPENVEDSQTQGASVQLENVVSRGPEILEISEIVEPDAQAVRGVPATCDHYTDGEEPVSQCQGQMADNANHHENKESQKQSLSPLVRRITKLARQLASDKDKRVEGVKPASEDATWILHPPGSSNDQFGPTRPNRIITASEGPEDFIEVHSFPNSEIFPEEELVAIHKKNSSTHSRDVNANKY